jgi:phenylpropionate dioxygenase-like ring-hydroxylating dioxygenase large terminal subunit
MNKNIIYFFYFFIFELQSFILQNKNINYLGGIRKYISEKKMLNNKRNFKNDTLTNQEIYDISWYVVGETHTFKSYIPKKVTIWNKDYVVWKNNSDYYACDNICPHRGASLAKGTICNNNIVCPYHGYEFNSNGELKFVPGLKFKENIKFNIDSFDIIERDGWVYLNTFLNDNNYSENVYIEPERLFNNTNNDFKQVLLKQDFKCYPRILTENSLDIMHIAYVHTFGNKEEPAPFFENTTKINKWHYKTSYLYSSGKKSIPRVLFNINNITVENEFIMPHTTVARVIFNGMISTIITSVLPINDNECTIFVKTYRNFIMNPFGDWYTSYAMSNTINEDRGIVENIDPNCIDGKYNMKFDKLQNIYRSMYKKHVHIPLK